MGDEEENRIRDWHVELNGLHKTKLSWYLSDDKHFYILQVQPNKWAICENKENIDDPEDPIILFHWTSADEQKVTIRKDSTLASSDSSFWYKVEEYKNVPNPPAKGWEVNDERLEIDEDEYNTLRETKDENYKLTSRRRTYYKRNISSTSKDIRVELEE